MHVRGGTSVLLSELNWQTTPYNSVLMGMSGNAVYGKHECR